MDKDKYSELIERGCLEEYARVFSSGGYSHLSVEDVIKKQVLPSWDPQHDVLVFLEIFTGPFNQFKNTIKKLGYYTEIIPTYEIFCTAIFYVINQSQKEFHELFRLIDILHLFYDVKNHLPSPFNKKYLYKKTGVLKQPFFCDTQPLEVSIDYPVEIVNRYKSLSEDPGLAYISLGSTTRNAKEQKIIQKAKEYWKKINERN